MINVPAHIINNKHLGHTLRRQLEQKHPIGTALRRILGLLDNEQLVQVYFDNETRRQEHKVWQTERANKRSAWAASALESKSVITEHRPGYGNVATTVTSLV